jgi:hypothetical protein
MFWEIWFVTEEPPPPIVSSPQIDTTVSHSAWVWDIGAGLPTVDTTLEVAQRVAPECRVVYAGNDPLVLVHAKALLTSARQGATAEIYRERFD